MESSFLIFLAPFFVATKTSSELLRSWLRTFKPWINRASLMEISTVENGIIL